MKPNHHFFIHETSNINSNQQVQYTSETVNQNYGQPQQQDFYFEQQVDSYNDFAQTSNQFSYADTNHQAQSSCSYTNSNSYIDSNNYSQYADYQRQYLDASTSDCQLPIRQTQIYLNSTYTPNEPGINEEHLQNLDNNQNLYDRIPKSPIDSQEWMDGISRHLIEHMNNFGICVMDDFLGQQKGNLILNEVSQLFANCESDKGQLVSDKLDAKTRNLDNPIRGDRVIWVDGCEDGCTNINDLIQTLSAIITNCSRLSLYKNESEFDRRVINKRTKAMIACYPGNGTRYVKHVDNPNADGRCITSIYYLNKDWDTQRDGGLLRMFPSGSNDIANITPLFDRVLFFWSDRRNPHEVQPSHRLRIAITVWFIDTLESG